MCYLKWLQFAWQDMKKKLWYLFVLTDAARLPIANHPLIHRRSTGMCNGSIFAAEGKIRGFIFMQTKVDYAFTVLQPSVIEDVLHRILIDFMQISNSLNHIHVNQRPSFKTLPYARASGIANKTMRTHKSWNKYMSTNSVKYEPPWKDDTSQVSTIHWQFISMCNVFNSVE